MKTMNSRLSMLDPIRAEPKIESEEIVRELLIATQTHEPPTKAERIAAYLNLDIVEYDPYTPPYNLPHNIRAFLIPTSRLIGVQRELTKKQKTFSVLHEVGHFVLPGHATRPSLLDEKGFIIQDTNDKLSITTTIEQEIEANRFAADCIFQLNRFDYRVHKEELNWENIVTAANDYGASFEATARRWIERSHDECGLIVFDPKDKTSGSPLRIMYTITSESFAEAYFAGVMPGYEMDEDTLVYKLFYQLPDNTVKDILRVNIASKGIVEFSMTLFTNSYRVLGLLTPLTNS